MTQITQKNAKGRRNAQIARRYALTWVAVLTLGSGTLSAQTVQGTVVDSATARPIASVSVELVGADSQVVARERSDNGGNFRLRARGDGLYRVRVQRIGYQSLDSLMDIKGDTTLALRLGPLPVALAPVAVTAPEDTYLRTSGFFERQMAGVGHFLDPPTVEKLGSRARLVVEMLDHIPGVSLVIDNRRAGLRVPHLRTCRTISRRLQPFFGAVAQNPVSAADSMADDLSRFPHIYLDGMKVGTDIFGSLLPNHILAVEVYMGPGQVPLQYGGTDAPCGVILIWSKH